MAAIDDHKRNQQIVPVNIEEAGVVPCYDLDPMVWEGQGPGARP